jgi:hypothetical protein
MATYPKRSVFPTTQRHSSPPPTTTPNLLPKKAHPMTQNSDYKGTDKVLAGVFRTDNTPSEPTTSHLDASYRVVGNVVRSSDADAAVSAPANWTFPVRNSGGMTISDPAAITPDHIVSLAPGDETTVANAMYLGLMTRNAAGHIVPVGSASAPQGNTQQEKPPELETQEPEPEPNPALDEASEALMTRAFSEAVSETLGMAVAVIYGEGSEEGAAEQLASRLNLEKHDAIAKVESVKAAYATEAYNVTARTMDTSLQVVKEALDAAQAPPATQSAFRRAAESHFHSGKPDYNQFVVDFIANLDQSDPQRILNAAPVAGRSVRYDHNSKQVLVKLPDGGEVSWDVAVRLGLISFR